MVWEKITKLLKASLLFDPERVRDFSKSLQQEVSKISQDLDMQVINFIVTCLLPNTGDIQLPGFESQRSFEQSLVQIIDFGCQNTL
jgi:hypothetical protein